MRLFLVIFLLLKIFSPAYANTIYYLTKIPNLQVYDLTASNGIKYLKAEKSFKVGIVKNNVQCNKPSENNIKNKFKDDKIILDPGIGFGKTLKHNLTLISNISLFHSLGFPILIGTSRKRFINQISGLYDSNERIGGTLASVLFLLSQGVQIFRVHNVREVKQGILVFEKILKDK